MVVEADLEGCNSNPTSLVRTVAPISEMSVLESENRRKEDEYDVDFSDAREFAIQRWNEILETTAKRLSPPDQETAAGYSDLQNLENEIHGKLIDQVSTPLMKQQIRRIQPLPRTMVSLNQLFTKLVAPLEVKFGLVGGLIHLNLKLSFDYPDRLKTTVDLLHKILNITALFNQSIYCAEVSNEALLDVVEFLDSVTTTLVDSIVYLHHCSSESLDAGLNQERPELQESINVQLSAMEQIVQHSSDLTHYLSFNKDRQIKNVSLRYALIPENDEAAIFPNISLPFKKNSRFYGRKDELEEINKFLRPKSNPSLRTYSIYGRRGVGKTEIALEFAHANHANFDAIFWVQCETSVAISQSFTSIAISLKLSAASREGHPVENLLAVQNWLKRTKKRWLMIFDNAERDQILQTYWPVGASGAILITSRSYHKFSKNILRKGETVSAFNRMQSWDLLFQLLGEDWKNMEREDRLAQAESIAAKNWLENLEGLALAIQQAAILIKSPEIGGPTIAKTFELFKEKIRTLPERYSHDSSNLEKSLHALWDMTFNSLSRNARALLGVLAWLFPNSIPQEIFAPRNQKALDGSLSFAKQDNLHVDAQSRASFLNMTTPSLEFERAARELLTKNLIRQDTNVYSIHRVVQEAVNVHNIDDLQESFDIASRLVYEQFPKQLGDGSLYNEWKTCRNYIHHGQYLSKRFSGYAESGVLKGSDFFVRLLSNCAWYLHEMGDYEVSGRIIQTAISACDDKTSLLYAQLLNIAGSGFFDLNRLSDCRGAWEVTCRILKEKLPDGDPLIASIYNNLGNLETASGMLETAQVYFDRACLIWVAGGASTTTYLAITYLCLGRMHMLRGRLDEAMRMTALSKSLFVKIFGADKGFMAHVHYNCGNIQFLQRHWLVARQEYDSCLNISLQETPIHPITAAAYYSLACVEFELQNIEMARAYLDKSKVISELRCPTRDDGVIARIMWKTAVVIENDNEKLGAHKYEATVLRKRANVARQQLLSSGEGGVIPLIDEDDARSNQEEDDFDAMVPLFFR